jgi:predicted anti-sigma-YlaC factor YlaD
MICPDRFSWNKYLDNEMDKNDRSRYAAHLYVCPECHSLVSELERQNELIALVLKDTSVPSDLEAMVKKRLAILANRRLRIQIGILSVLTISAILMGSIYWWSLMAGTQGFLNTILVGSLKFEVILFLVRFLISVGGETLKGGSVTPALTLLIIVMFWLSRYIKKGGYANA